MFFFFAPSLHFRKVTLAVVLSAVCLLTFSVKNSAAEQKQAPVNILVLDSYSPSMPWSQAIFKGLDDVRKTVGRNIHFYIEYLHSATAPNSMNPSELADFIKKKYRNIHFSGLVTNSNSATTFAYKYGKFLVGDAPKVFYTSDPVSFSANDPSVFSLWGDVEHAVKKTANIALKQNPQARSILILEGNNEASREVVGMLRKQLAEATSLPVRTLSEFSMAKLKKKIADLDDKTIVFVTLIWTDSLGARFIPKRVAAELALLSSSPIYTFWSPFIGTGVVGGHMLDGTVVGGQLLVALMDYLKNGSFEDSYNTLQTFWDWDAMERYGIDSAKVSPDAIVINLPQTLWEKYRHEIMGTSISLFLLAVSVFFWIFRISVLNKKLRHSRDTLELRVAERTSKLNGINKELTDSEARFRSLSEASFECIFIIRSGIIIEVNQIIVGMFGYSQKECSGKSAMDFVAEHERENVKNKILSGYEKPYQSCGLRKDGSTFPIEIRGKMFWYKEEWSRVTAVRDITERRKAEEALKQANEKLKELAMLDGLTGISNRRSFDTKLENEWRRMARESKPLSIFLFDVDFFKLYNDRYGHQAGDVCLQDIAKEANSVLQRPGDLLARYGGEEFIAVLPDTDGEGAVHLAEQVRQQIYELKIPHDASKIARYVTVSCGVAAVVPSESDTFHELLKAADEALYAAKEAGRNKVVNKLDG